MYFLGGGELQSATHYLLATSEPACPSTFSHDQTASTEGVARFNFRTRTTRGDRILVQPRTTIRFRLPPRIRITGRLQGSETGRKVRKPLGSIHHSQSANTFSAGVHPAHHFGDIPEMTRGVDSSRDSEPDQLERFR